MSDHVDTAILRETAKAWRVYSVGVTSRAIVEAADAIDALRLKLAWTEQISQDRGEENDRLRNMLADSIVVHHDDQAEIDRLRAAAVAFSRLCGCESDCEFDGNEIVHRPCCFRWEP